MAGFILLFFLSIPLQAQISFGTLKDSPDKTESGKESSPEDLKGEQSIVKYRAGMVFEARQGGPCDNITGTVPVPLDFPEQKVRIIEENFPKNARVYYRELKEGGVKQLVLKMPTLRPGQKIEATVLFEVTKYALLAPKETKGFVIPKKATKKTRQYLRDSIYFESDSRMVRNAAKTAVADKKGAWDKVEGIFQYVRDNVQYKEELKQGQIRGALSALRTKAGDCEDMCALFISMCRAQNIPARLVWVEGHCYAEFYLEDTKGESHWFPAQVAGTEPLGGMADTRIILQKGDNFKVPEDPQSTVPYVKELFTGSVKNNGPDPKYQFIKEISGN